MASYVAMIIKNLMFATFNAITIECALKFVLRVKLICNRVQNNGMQYLFGLGARTLSSTPIVAPPQHFVHY